MRSQRAVVLAVSLLSVLYLGATTSLGQSGHSKAEDSQTNRTDGLAAWQQLYSVMSHPRCVNCHTASDYPQQGGDRHRHLFNLVRGPGGEGVPAFSALLVTSQRMRTAQACPALRIGTSRRLR